PRSFASRRRLTSAGRTWTPSSSTTPPRPRPPPHPAERAGASAHSKWRDMITFTHRVAGEECKINFPERRADISEFQDFLSRGDKVIGVDSETSGLDVFSPGFELRSEERRVGKECDYRL